MQDPKFNRESQHHANLEKQAILVLNFRPDGFEIQDRLLNQTINHPYSIRSTIRRIG